RRLVWPGICNATAPPAQTRTSPQAAPAASPPSVSSTRKGGTRWRLLRANDPIVAAIACTTTAPTTAPASAATGRYGELVPPCSRCGATRAPASAPPTSPASESAVPISPRRKPPAAASTTTAIAIQSRRLTRLSCRGGHTNPPFARRQPRRAQPRLDATAALAARAGRVRRRPHLPPERE